MTWSLPELLAGLHQDIEQQLSASRSLMGHPVDKGNASEAVWLEMLNKYLPRRYAADKATIADSQGSFSHQIDVVIYDRQYSPFIFRFKETNIIPAESVYAVFEAKQSVNAEQVRYAEDKIASVRALHRTSLPIPSAGGPLPAKPLHHILGGLLTFESDWSPALGQSLTQALTADLPHLGYIDLGCVATRGHYRRDAAGDYTLTNDGKPATAFLFELLSLLQEIATVPMIDIRAYARWLA